MPVERRLPVERRMALRRLGVASLRPGQREVIEGILAGTDTLAIMPTGGGKSLCYQLPGLLQRGTTVVVSPLISLMKDQADKLSSRGLSTETINSALPAQERRDAWRQVRHGRAEFVFTTPEQLENPELIALLKRHPIDLFVVDEAHCVSQWGHDFRPAYLAIPDALAALGNPPLLALTATAPHDVAEDIRRLLRRPAMRTVSARLYRPNLRFQVRQTVNEEEKFSRLLDWLRRHRGAGIVYASTVKVAKQVHERLATAGEQNALYHGRLGAGERARAQEAFVRGEVRIMVATNAFGMGIDKPDVRLVVHYQMPASLEEYYQEAGRAGRDGETALCLLLYEHSDVRIQLFFAGGHESKKCAEDRARVERMAFYARSAHCRWQMILEYFGEDPLPGDGRCGHCDNCRRPVREERPALAIPPDAPRWQRGDAVLVRKYGRGVVERCTADQVDVSFPGGVTRPFAPDFVSSAD